MNMSLMLYSLLPPDHGMEHLVVSDRANNPKYTRRRSACEKCYDGWTSDVKQGQSGIFSEASWRLTRPKCYSFGDIMTFNMAWVLHFPRYDV